MLFWYRHTRSHTSDHEPEEPVDLSLRTVLKYRGALWIQLASMQDSGMYICMLRNMTSCVKISVRLEVFPPNSLCNDTLQHKISVPIQSNYTLRCPNLQHLPSNTYNVTWYYECRSNIINSYMMEVHGDEVVIYQMLTMYAGLYTCVVHYQSNGHTFHYSHGINVKAVSSKGPKQPKILNPAVGETNTVTVGKKADFVCRAFLPYLDDEQGQVWWSINNKTLEELSDSRYTSPAFRVLLNYHDDLTVERVLNVSQFNADDLSKEFRCYVHNSQGIASRAITLTEEVYIPSVELGCGLGVTLALALLLFVLYRVFWLEVHLLYRSWFGTDERDTDDKEYDVYISYARNTEEEEFVMTTLRHVLESEFGYTVCIFDRDSLPGGTVTEETLQFVSRSRRLLVILSACSAFRDGQALLEFRAGVAAMLHGASVKLVLIQFKSGNKDTTKHTSKTHTCVKELQRARIALAVVRWEGEKSTPLTSHFWKRLRLQLPVRTSVHATTNHTEHNQTAKHTHNTKQQSPETAELMMETIQHS
ncbi:interleukin-1 receptor accessory protein isoform X2 [Trichomycterus rosablanca]